MAGQLFLTPRHLLFCGRSFGVSSQKKIPLSEIELVNVKNTHLTIRNTKNSLTFTFKEPSEAVEAHDMVKELWQRHSKSLPTTPQSSSPSISRFHIFFFFLINFLMFFFPNRRTSGSEVTQLMNEVFNALPQSDWDIMLKGAKTIVIPKGELIVHQGEEYQRIFQIVRGDCRIDLTNPSGNRFTVGYIRAGETFGEISFLSGKGATADVIADTEVEVTIIEGYFINALINVDLGFGGRFFRYVAILLSHRVRERNSKRDESAN